MRRLLQRLADGLRGAFGLCDHGFEMRGDGFIVSRDLEVVTLARRLTPHGTASKFQIRCRCCHEIVARRDFEHMEILGV